jgi:HSP20 family protein
VLLCFDPYLDVDQLAERLLGLPLPARRIPMDAVQRGQCVVLRCDLPGVDPASVSISMTDHILTVRAERGGPEQEGDQPLELECAQGLVARDVLLGDVLDPRRIEHDFRDGVLVVTIPMVSQPAVARTEG